MSRRARIVLLSLVLLTITLLAGVVWARSSTYYTIWRQVLSGGGAPAASGSGEVTLNASLGQTVVGVSTLADGDTILEAGYWSSTTEERCRVYLPIMMGKWEATWPRGDSLERED